MREILFRGKRKDNGEWVQGAYFNLHHNDRREHMHHFIIPNNTPIPKEKPIGEIQVEVIPETVGEFTGWVDKNGVKIFEGDIMQLCSATYPCTVYWDGIGWAWTVNKKRRDIDLTREKMEVIGNIYENNLEE